MANHGPTNMANHEPTIMANQNNQKFGAKMQSRERNQNFGSHAIRGYCCEQNYGRFKTHRGILILTLTRADVGFELSLISQSEQIC